MDTPDLNNTTTQATASASNTTETPALQVFDQGLEGVTPSNDTPVANNQPTPEQVFEDAFMRASDHYERTKSFPDGSFADSDSVTSAPGVAESEPTSPAQTTSTPPEQPQPAAEIPAPVEAPQVPENDYRQLYEQALRDKEAASNLWATRMAALSEQYQSLKSAARTQAVDNTQTWHAPDMDVPLGTYPVTSSTSTMDDPSIETLKAKSPAVKELFEYYPEIATAVSELIETKSNHIAKTVEEQVKPLQQTLQQQTAQQLYTKIATAHPDIQELIQGNKLRQWADSLEPVMRTGANAIMQYGNADEVISLINQYKLSTGKAAGLANATSTPATTAPAHPREKEIINRVMSAMSVPTGDRSSQIRQVVTPTFSSEVDAFDAIAAEYESKYGTGVSRRF
jgi:hypothetical protein